MAVYLVRAGSQGEREDFALAHNVSPAGWAGCQFDLSKIMTRDDLGEILYRAYPHESVNVRGNWKGQLWLLVMEMQVGDIILLPLKTQPAIAIGEISSDYYYVKENPIDFRHLRNVNKWFIIPRNRIDADILDFLTAPVTIRKNRRENVEKRIRELME